MISRQWRGLAKRERAGEYVEHLRRDTFPQLARIAGFVDASILRRPVERGVEFLVVTRWQSLDAIRRFAGADAETAVVPLRARGMKRLQLGVGTFGTLVILAVAGAAGYYIYKSVFEPDSVSPPSCKSQLNSCIANCRKTTTEAPQAQACQSACQRDAAACEARKR